MIHFNYGSQPTSGGLRLWFVVSKELFLFT